MMESQGNTLLPCLLGGDIKQLPPAVMTSAADGVYDLGKEDGKGGPVMTAMYNPLIADGSLSGLAFFQCQGFPVYRLRTQMRIAKGLFDIIGQTIYPEVDWDYEESFCDIDLPKFKMGRDLDSYVVDKYSVKTLVPEGKLAPIFLHCPSAMVSVDARTGSRRSPDQVQVALKFLVDFVNAKHADPREIGVLSPYSGIVAAITRELKKPAYSALSNMRPPSTIDGYQGQEMNVMVVVLATKFPNPGPGFTSNPKRLNVMMTRQKCGLVIVGDINVAGKVDGSHVGDKKGKRKRKGKGKGKEQDKRIKVEGPEGQITSTRRRELRSMNATLWQLGRVANVDVVGQVEL